LLPHLLHKPDSVHYLEAPGAVAGSRGPSQVGVVTKREAFASVLRPRYVYARETKVVDQVVQQLHAFSEILILCRLISRLRLVVLTVRTAFSRAFGSGPAA
jgi:hypothetical protein